MNPSAMVQAQISDRAGRLKLVPVFALILYKERHKLRLGWPILALFNLLAVLYLYLETRHLFRMDHAEIVWYRSIELGHIYYGLLRYVPTITGLALAVMQFLPEMRDERLRLALHLPVRAHNMILSHLLVGSLLLAALMTVAALGLILVTSLYFPRELVEMSLLTSAPWFLAGWCGYLGAALALLEPGLKLRLFNLLLTGGLIVPLLTKAAPGAYASAFPALLLTPPLLLGAVLLPAHHFRHRRVET